MTKNITLIIILLLAWSCSHNQPKAVNWKVSVSESFGLVELFPNIIEANTLIRKMHLDSAANQKSGISILDDINKQKAGEDTISGNSIEDYPLAQVLALNTKLDNNGKGFIDSTTIIGTIEDSITLKKYLTITDSLFPANLVWTISGNLYESRKCLHAFVNNGVRLSLDIADIDSVFAISLGLDKFLGIALKNNDLTGYWVDIKLKNELNKTLGNRLYSIILKSDTCEYSGSIVNFEHNPNQRITIGVMNMSDFQDFKNRFQKRVIINN